MLLASFCDEESKHFDITLWCQPRPLVLCTLVTWSSGSNILQEECEPREFNTRVTVDLWWYQVLKLRNTEEEDSEIDCDFYQKKPTISNRWWKLKLMQSSFEVKGIIYQSDTTSIISDVSVSPSLEHWTNTELTLYLFQVSSGASRSCHWPSLRCLRCWCQVSPRCWSVAGAVTRTQPRSAGPGMVSRCQEQCLSWAMGHSGWAWTGLETMLACISVASPDQMLAPSSPPQPRST